MSVIACSRSTDNLIFGSKHNWKIAIINGSKIIQISSNKYSHLSNNRGGWNKRGGSAKVAKSINMEVGKN